jgi:hypothetical protein
MSVAGAAVFVVNATPASAASRSVIVQERNVTVKSNGKVTLTHTIQDDWRGKILNVWLVPDGDCDFSVAYTWYETDTQDRYKYEVINNSSKNCTTKVKIVATDVYKNPLAFGDIQPGRSRSFVYTNAYSSPVWLAGARTSTAGCALEISKVWYGRKPGEPRKFYFTVKNRGAVTCAGEALFGRIDNTTKIATKLPGGNPVDYYTRQPASEAPVFLGYSPAEGQTCTIGTTIPFWGVQLPFIFSQEWTSWAVAPSSVDCEFSTYKATLT